MSHGGEGGDGGGGMEREEEEEGGASEEVEPWLESSRDEASEFNCLWIILLSGLSARG